MEICALWMDVPKEWRIAGQVASFTRFLWDAHPHLLRGLPEAHVPERMRRLLRDLL